MRVLVGCEFSGVVREAFRARGHEAWSCDLLAPPDNSRAHIQSDLNFVLFYPNRVLGGMPRWMREAQWDLLIAHPPCTYLCNSSVWALTRTPPRPSDGVLYGDARMTAMRDSAEFFRRLLDAPIPKIAVENPVMHGHAKAIIGRGPDQIIQPYNFGEDASKATGLWLKGLPPLMPTRIVNPRYVNGKPRWGNQTDGGQNKLGPSADRWAKRAETYPGIAAAMAQQWGDL